MQKRAIFLLSEMDVLYWKKNCRKEKDTLFIAGSSESLREIGKAGISAIDFMNLVDSDSYSIINREAESLSKYLLEDAFAGQTFRSRAIPLGNLFSVDLTYFLVWLFKQLLAWKKIAAVHSINTLLTPNLPEIHPTALRYLNTSDPFILNIMREIATHFGWKLESYQSHSIQTRKQSFFCKERFRLFFHLPRLFTLFNSAFKGKKGPLVLAYGNYELMVSILDALKTHQIAVGWWNEAIWIKKLPLLLKRKEPFWNPLDTKIYTLFSRHKPSDWQEKKNNYTRWLLKENLQFAGFCLPSLLMERLALLFDHFLPDAERKIVLLELFFKKRKVKALIVDQDISPEKKGAVLVAKKLGIPSFVILHGYPASPAGYVPVSADKILVWSNQIKAWLKDHGVPEEKIVVTGNPKWDKSELSAQKTKAYTFLIASKPITEQSCLAGYSFRWRDLEIFYEQALEGLFPWLQSRSVAIKLHPLDNKKHWTEMWIKNWLLQKGIKASICIFKGEVSSLDLIASSEIVLSLPVSTIVVEALALRKPIVMIGNSFPSSLHDFGEKGMVWAAKNVLDVKNSVEEIFQRERAFKQRMERLECHLPSIIGPQDGRTSARIASLIRGKIDGSS